MTSGGSLMVEKTIKFPFFTHLEDYHDGHEYASFLSKALGCKVRCEEIIRNDDYSGYPECQKLAMDEDYFKGYPFRFFLQGQER
jgi:hypothetical protein